MDTGKVKNMEVVARKRKVMLMLPVMLIPMITLGFFALGGGKGTKPNGGLRLTKGLNMSLPEAKLGGRRNGLNKLGFYKQSEQDSIKLRARRKMDPYWERRDSSVAKGADSYGRMDSGLAVPGAGGGLKMERTPLDMQAAGLLQKLDLLKGALGRQEQGVLPVIPVAGEMPGRRSYEPEEQRVTLPFPGVPVKGTSGDPDIDKLNTLMDKVLRVRYPGDAPLRDTSAPVSEGQPVRALSAPAQEDAMRTLPGQEAEDLGTGFIDLDESGGGDTAAGGLIAATIDGAQTVISGEEVVLRTAEEATIGGTRMPRGTLLTGKGTLSGERLLIAVNSVRLGVRALRVSLDVVDMDGVAGIRVKGSINRDVSKETADEAVGSLDVTSTDPSVTGQATAVGIQAAKTLLSRKIRLVRVGLPGGYRVFLRNSKTK